MKNVIFDCDCGCGEKSKDGTGWFILRQDHHLTAHRDKVKLEQDMNFATLMCVGKWVEKVVPAIARLEKTAGDWDAGTYRGRFVDKEAPGIYV